MKWIFKIVSASTLAGMLSMPPPAARMDDMVSIVMMKPLQGISFDIGTKRAESYFVSDSGTCQLVLTLGDPIGPNNQMSNATPTRFEAAIKPERALHYISEGGLQVEFVCQARAENMSVRTLDEIAANILMWEMPQR